MICGSEYKTKCRQGHGYAFKKAPNNHRYLYPISKGSFNILASTSLSWWHSDKYGSDSDVAKHFRYWRIFYHCSHIVLKVKSLSIGSTNASRPLVGELHAQGPGRRMGWLRKSALSPPFPYTADLEFSQLQVSVRATAVHRYDYIYFHVLLVSIFDRHWKLRYMGCMQS